MGMINHRHDILKRESQALWRVVLQEGGAATDREGYLRAPADCERFGGGPAGVWSGCFAGPVLSSLVWAASVQSGALRIEWSVVCLLWNLLTAVGGRVGFLGRGKVKADGMLGGVSGGGGGGRQHVGKALAGSVVRGALRCFLHFGA